MFCPIRSTQTVRGRRNKHASYCGISNRTSFLIILLNRSSPMNYSLGYTQLTCFTFNCTLGNILVSLTLMRNF